MFSNSTGTENTAMGWNALNNTSTGTGNTAVGTLALSVNTTGTFNINRLGRQRQFEQSF
jgi:hypothetical protein